jgi:hypothetical protein
MAGYGRGMPRIDIPDVTARTTSDRAGHPHMVVAAAGEGPMDALGGLAARAGAEAERIAAGYRDDPENRGRPDAVWRFEVVDVRLVPGTVADGAQNWAAYGTLVSEGANPWAASFWEQRH